LYLELIQSIRMTFYHQQVLAIRAECYPPEYLTDRLLLARAFIDAHDADDLDLDTMAKNAMLSKFHFARLFKRFYGRTPYQYLMERKLQKARSLLAQFETVQNTCHLLGFQSRTSFCALFKSHAGVSPSAYRKKQVSRHPSR
jgi:AraC-like DNA-binding protein